MSRARGWLIVAAFVVYASPLAWQARTSVVTDQALVDGFRLAPADLTLAHYRIVFTQSPLLPALVNSAGIGLITTALAIALGTPAAYALARLPVPGRRLILLGVILSTAFPAIATVAPLYLIIRALGLRDTWTGLVLAQTSFALPITIWLVSDFIRDVPASLEESAFVDGAGRLRALRHVVAPVIAPGVAAAALLTFLFSWNEFLFAYTFTATEASRTAPVAMALFPGVFEVPWGDLAAAAVLTALPPALVVVVLRRHLVRGLLAGAVKE